VGDVVAPFIALPDTDSLAILPDDPAAAAEDIHGRRETIGLSYSVFGADVSDAEDGRR
jgi:hypothetical protein